MKKAIAILLVFCLCLGLCACTGANSAAQKLEKLKTKLESADSITELESIINSLREMKDTEGAQALLDEATAKLDALYLSLVHYNVVTAKNGVQAQEYAKKLSDQVTAEKICVWIDFQWYMQNVHKAVVEKFKQGLKDPNSYTDIGSTYTYNLEPAEEAGKLIIKNYTLTLKYTATNSFGGVVQDSYKCSPADLIWEHGCKVLTVEQVCEVLSFSTFDGLYNTIKPA